MYTYNATVVGVHDGDTCTLDIDLGFDTHRIQHVRLAGCNARELAQPGGQEARANLAVLLPPGRQVIVSTVKLDKYADRVDAVITLPDGHDLAQLLCATGWAATWNGHGTKPVPGWPRTS